MVAPFFCFGVVSGMKRAVKAAGMAAVFGVLASFMPAVAGDDELARFLDKRAAYAAALTEPIAACVARDDTDHPVFRGCIDWHSSVHGVWALTAYRGVSGDTRHESIIHARLTADALARELADLRARPDFEMPYGRAWFLRLAIDYERVFGDRRLSALAREAAQSLIAYYTRVDPDPLSTAYDSASWALINLHEFGVATKDARIVAFVEGKVRSHFLGDGPCPLQSVEIETREFMAVCTNWAWLVSKMLPREAFRTWLAKFLPEELAIEPIRSEASVHQAGLNFSRAWGLWHLYRATGERRFLSAYLAHFHATFDRPEVWKGDYGTLSHWVAQFGMRALMVSFEAPLSRQ